MKKAEQLAINNEVIEVHNSILGYIDDDGLHYDGRLRTCKAAVYSTFGYDLLYSYDTLVAAYDRSEAKGYDFLRYTYHYTVTSAHHIAKFFADRNCRVRRITYRPF